MIQRSLMMTLAALVLVSLFAQFPPAKAQSNGTDEAAIKNVVANFSADFNRKDAHACAMLFAEDGELTTVRGDITRGRVDLEKHYQTVFATFLKNAHRTDKVRSVRFLTPTIASVDTDWTVAGATSPNGTEPAPAVREGLLTWIVMKQDGRWYISLFHELDFPGK